jgi:8-oxo-dGTP pyrophosphatase MutT (NUDIX family)
MDGDADMRRAAVLVPFVTSEEGELEVLLTRRAAELGTHAGQISFPGGRIDPTDRDATAAALRECEEELGIRAESIEVLGELDHVVTAGTRFQITPIAGHLRGRPVMTPNPAEVAEALFIPFRAFVEERTMELVDMPRRKAVVFYRFGEVTVWGATARILRQLTQALRTEQ